jgi:hypothetical protein
MDKKITVRFYRVLRVTETDPSFSNCLTEVGTHRMGVWHDVGDEITVRMERFQSSPPFIHCEFSRKQTENIPPRAKGDHEDLEVNPDHLAHLMAFQYHPATGVIAVEVNRNGMGIGRINSFLKSMFDGHNGFDFEPVLAENAWQKFDESEPRKFVIGVASPENLSVVEGPAGHMRQNLVAMKELMGGATIEACVGFGRKRDGLLNKPIVRDLVGYFTTQEDNGAQVTKLQVKGEGEADIIDFLASQLKSKGTLDLGISGIDGHYNERKRFIQGAFGAHMATIQHMYGQRA